MTPTITDLFCGAGGSSLGAEAAGGTLVMAANHWQTAIDVHQANFPDAGHDCADISQADPRRYPVTDILLASPECTNHSQARGVSRKRQDPTLWDAPDPAAERSRATMWDVVRFAEQITYKAIVVENVVEATKWVLWHAWWQAMESLGYQGRILSHNSMHHGVPQSRDRIYVVWTRPGLQVDLEMEHHGWCPHCNQARTARQAFKPGRRVGRYRQQWVWSCTTCQRPIDPACTPAATIIDWTLSCPRIGDRTRPLATATRARILAGLQRYGWAPITTSGAGHSFERTPGNRARPVSDPVATQTCTGGSALATPPGFLFQPARARAAVEKIVEGDLVVTSLLELVGEAIEHGWLAEASVESVAHVEGVICRAKTWHPLKVQQQKEAHVVTVKKAAPKKAAPKKKPAVKPSGVVQLDTMYPVKWVVVRSRDAGAFLGRLIRQNGGEVQLADARRLWYWDGAASLSQIALEGVSKPTNCKFPPAVTEITIIGACEIITATPAAVKSIQAVPAWRA